MEQHRHRYSGDVITDLTFGYRCDRDGWHNIMASKRASGTGDYSTVTLSSCTVLLFL